MYLRDRGRADRLSRCFRACEGFHERARSSRVEVHAGECSHPLTATSSRTSGYCLSTDRQVLRHGERSTSSRQPGPGYPGPGRPCEKFPRDRSLVRGQPWANVCAGASPYRLDGPRAAVNGPRSSLNWVTAAARLRRAAHLTRRPVTPPPRGGAEPDGLHRAVSPESSCEFWRRRLPWASGHSDLRHILAL